MGAALAILDTNVWLDWLGFDDPRVASIASAYTSGELAFVACERARAELVDVIGRESLLRQVEAARLRRGLGPLAPGSASGDHVVQRFDALVRLMPSAPRAPLRCSDPDDQHLVDLAVAHRVSWLLTHDRAVLALARRARLQYGVRIAKPEALARAGVAAAPTITTGRSA